MIGSTVKVVVDQPLESYHPKHKDIYYPINYGFFERIIAPDGVRKNILNQKLKCKRSFPWQILLKSLIFHPMN